MPHHSQLPLFAILRNGGTARRNAGRLRGDVLPARKSSPLSGCPSGNDIHDELELDHELA